MNYDFDTINDRRGSGSMKWDGHGDDADVIQLWVADMDFRTAPAIIDALTKRVSSGIFGYTDVPASYYDALRQWFLARHGWEIDREKVIYTSGVVPALSAIIKALTSPGDGVIVQMPAYNCFFSSIRNNKCRQLDNPLLRTDTATGFTYGIDYRQLEELASRPDTRLLILCNPHNPTGRIWRRDELEQIRDICRRHDVRVISDEIHCELIHEGCGPYIPYATVDDTAVVCCSPSKAFNTAGLQIANIVCTDETTRALIDRAINDNEVCDVNPFGVIALQAAYNEGAAWLEALNSYLDDNFRFLRDFITTRLPKLNVCDSESTYLAWVDITGTGMNGDEVERLLVDKARVRISSGGTYGDNGYIRINYACSRSLLEKALIRIADILC